MPEISVIIATHNRADFLEPCLLSLCEQTLDSSRYEICVINNACTDATDAVVASVAARYPTHRLFRVYEPVAGLSRARNCGILATRAPLIANIDDDATAEPNWLEIFLTRFASLEPEVAAIGGEVDPVWQSPPPDWLEPWMKGMLSAGSARKPIACFLDSNEGCLECNTCYRRTALLNAGLYPTELGRTGTLLLSGEGAINLILLQKGWRLFFEPAALIHHTIHADRLAPLWFRKRSFWQGVTHYATRQYYERHGFHLTESLTVDLPLALSDWEFIAKDTPQNLRASLLHFESLGFVLAMTGIIPVTP